MSNLIGNLLLGLVFSMFMRLSKTINQSGCTIKRQAFLFFKP
ncbi:hypothetical protein PCIT_b1160 [Pseudoalteromonas citrea]|uniref:Uncharacterized protein n=1 Tax=Pseudoalteromonas citrea TaxID=43655 RepID=A0AAD4AFL3_9GAMM|nr:hypothetical protein PCIT_b1160 [Pseudoalteromonas citrea]